MARFDNLPGWLDWQETLHPDPIDLGLERAGEVASRLGLLSPNVPVISVAGTNGKGSSVALLDAIYRAAGYRTGVYTSPHLLKYNERICIDGRQVDDTSLCAAFARIDTTRDGISLTYFEFGTLAALEIFSQAQVDILLLEVGMGGRLDAVNIVDADAALVTAIGLDHRHWLGSDREAIGSEKAGIFRRGRPAVCSDPHPPGSVQQVALSTGADWKTLGEHFCYSTGSDGWDWQAGSKHLTALPYPALAGRHQLDNAAGVLMVTELLHAVCPVPPGAVADGLRSVSLAGRCQVVPGRITRILDVAHNLESGQQLAGFLEANPVAGDTWLVFGMLSDKDVAGFADILASYVDHWCLVDLAGKRGLSGSELESMIGRTRRVQTFKGVAEALAHVNRYGKTGDRVVVTGSFFTVAAALASQV